MKIKLIAFFFCVGFLISCSDNTSTLVIESEDSKLIDSKDKKEHVELLVEEKDEEEPWTRWLYFGNPEDDNKIYRMTKDGEQLQKLSNGKMKGIKTLQEEIYFLDSENLYEEGKIKKVAWNGKNEQTIIPQEVDQFVVAEDNIFFVRKNELYRSSKDGKNIESLVTFTGSIINMIYKNNSLYFNNDAGIYKINSNGDEISILLEGNYHSFNIYKEELIYTKNDVVLTYNINTKKESVLLTSFNYELFLEDEWLIYSDGHWLMRKNIMNKKEEKIFIGNYSCDFYSDDNYIYCFCEDFIWRVDKEFDNKRILFGKGKISKHNMILMDDNKTFFKGYDFEYYNNHIYIYKYNNTPEKLIEEPVNEAYLKNDKMYYILEKDNKLYEYDFENQNKYLVIDIPISEFTFINDEIYFSRLDKNYALYVKTKDGSINKCVSDGVYNLKSINEQIYYINRKDNNSLYTYNSKENNKILEGFVTQYSIFEDKIYFRNENKNGELHVYKNGKSERVNKDTIDYLYKMEGKIYYVNMDNPMALVELDPKTEEVNTIKLMDSKWIDYFVKDNKVFEITTLEGGSINIKETSRDQEIGMYIGDEISYNRLSKNTYLHEYEHHLYRYDKRKRDFELLFPYPIREYKIYEDKIYITGDVQEDYNSYIKSINLKNKEIKTLVENTEQYSPSYEFIVYNDYLYYMLPFGDDKGLLYKKSIIEEEKPKLITNDCFKILEEVNSSVLCKNSKQHIYSIDLFTEEKKELTSNKSEYLGIYNDYLVYFEYVGEENEGNIIKLDLKTNSAYIIDTIPVDIWNAYKLEEYIYYLSDNKLIKYNLKTEERNILKNNANHFYIYEGELVIYLENDSIEIIPLNI